MRAFSREIGRSILRTSSRFWAIFAIVALGAGFYAGLSVCGTDMRATADAYYDGSNLMDLHVVSTLGLTDGDVKAVASAKGVRAVMPSYTADVVSKIDGMDQTFRVHSIPSGGPGNGPSDMNRPVLVSGRWPKNAGECVVGAKRANQSAVRIGDTISISDRGGSQSGLLKYGSFRIVGVVSSSYYICFSLGSTEIANGNLDYYMYVRTEDFKSSVYTDLYATVDGASALDGFSGSYDDAVKAASDSVKDLSADREEARYEQLYADAKKELDGGRAEYDRNKADADKKLADAARKLADGEAAAERNEKRLDDSEKQVESGEAALEKGERGWNSAKKQWSDGTAKLAEAEKTLAENQKKYDESAKRYGDSKNAYDASVKEFESQKQQAEQELSAAQAKINQGKKQIKENESKLSDAGSQLSSAWAQLQKSKEQLDGLKQNIDMLKAIGDPEGMVPSLQQQYDAGLQQYEAGLAQYEGGREEYNEGRAQLNDAKSQLEDAQKELDANRESTRKQFDDAQKKLDDGKKQLDQAQAELEDGKKQLDSGRAELEANRKKLEGAESELDRGRAELDANRAKLRSARAELASGRTKLTDAKADLAKGRSEYEKTRDDAQRQLSDAEKKLDDGAKELSELKKPEWYVLDRQSNVGYVSFRGDAGRMDSLSTVFPLIFFLVAALVALTTMTRMVEEERVLIGTYKALGYGSAKIASKYLIYAALASVAGSAAGIAVGMAVLPRIVWSAYGILYSAPALAAPPNLGYAFTAAAASVFCTLAATFAACRSELAETPANLMMPRAPKAGKRIVLERIGFLWSRMNFTRKVTARNLFRYKKRLLMTVTGIAGCTALLVTGFGIKDSVSEIISKQFDEVYVYNSTVSLKNGDVSPGLESLLDDPAYFSGWMKDYSKSTDVSANGNTVSAYLFVPENPSKLKTFIRLRDRVTGNDVPFGGDSVVLTEKLAKLLGVGPGGSISVKNADGREVQFRVTGVTEHYVYHYVYISPSLYQSKMGEKAVGNEVLSVCTVPDAAQRADLTSQVMKQDGVGTFTYLHDTTSKYDSMIQSMNLIVLVLIVSAGMLAFIVLYNLTNINVTERQRELATIKVLGFYDGEVSAYIYRETSILTVVGCALGLGFGVLMHSFVAQTAEVDMMMFGRIIKPMSFVWSAALTLLFGMIVNLVMYRKLKAIDMVESLKSVD